MASPNAASPPSTTSKTPPPDSRPCLPLIF